ncbi:hypothetical protein NKDENANG_02959 [Candidatus Entotheonellaceae bacterium PAL068K]
MAYEQPIFHPGNSQRFCAKNGDNPAPPGHSVDDQNPSPANDLGAALTAAGVEHEFHRYDGAGHGFQDFVNPERYCKEAAEDAWERVLSFFDCNLK